MLCDRKGKYDKQDRQCFPEVGSAKFFVTMFGLFDIADWETQVVYSNNANYTIQAYKTFWSTKRKCLPTYGGGTILVKQHNPGNRLLQTPEQTYPLGIANLTYHLWKKALQKRKSCKFPFVYKQITFNACTTLDSEDGTPWCSTKVDQRTRKHIEREGAYGECLNDTCKIVPFSNANETSLLSAE